jgi:diadenosine tetraphosphatase ApaH/serine/threonine PP2A family protein phosphatase
MRPMQESRAMRQALLSDIHGNLEALQAVLADVAKQKVNEILCLGDVVGYGPNPIECLELVMKKSKLTILGNHDQAAVVDPSGFNPIAFQAIQWTRKELNRGPSRAVNIRWDYINELPKSYQADKFLFVHGSPCDPTNEYVFHESVYDRHKMDRLFAKVPQYCFQGHTHIPAVFTPDCEFITPENCDYTFSLGREKLMINVGSVGQPRDEDPRACYTIVDYDAKKIFFRRVEYDIETTVAKIYAISEIDNQLGDRLRSGR